MLRAGNFPMLKTIKLDHGVLCLPALLQSDFVQLSEACLRDLTGARMLATLLAQHNPTLDVLVADSKQLDCLREIRGVQTQPGTLNLAINGEVHTLDLDQNESYQASFSKWTAYLFSVCPSLFLNSFESFSFRW